MTKIASLSLAAALLAPLPAAAEQFTILIYEPASELALRSQQGPEGGADWEAWDAYMHTLKATGTMRGGAPLGMPAGARVLRDGDASDGAPEWDGLSLSGYIVIEAPDLEAAEAMAAGFPSVHRGGAAELRAAYPALPM